MGSRRGATRTPLYLDCPNYLGWQVRGRGRVLAGAEDGNRVFLQAEAREAARRFTNATLVVRPRTAEAQTEPNTRGAGAGAAHARSGRIHTGRDGGRNILDRVAAAVVTLARVVDGLGVATTGRRRRGAAGRSAVGRTGRTCEGRSIGPDIVVDAVVDSDADRGALPLALTLTLQLGLTLSLTLRLVGDRVAAAKDRPVVVTDSKRTCRDERKHKDCEKFFHLKLRL